MNDQTASALNRLWKACGQPEYPSMGYGCEITDEKIEMLARLATKKIERLSSRPDTKLVVILRNEAPVVKAIVSQWVAMGQPYEADWSQPTYAKIVRMGTKIIKGARP